MRLTCGRLREDDLVPVLDQVRADAGELRRAMLGHPVGVRRPGVGPGRAGRSKRTPSPPPLAGSRWAPVKVLMPELRRDLLAAGGSPVRS